MGRLGLTPAGDWASRDREPALQLDTEAMGLCAGLGLARAGFLT